MKDVIESINAITRILFGRHRIRAVFYHGSVVIAVVVLLLWEFGLVSDNISVYAPVAVLVIDWIAEMYDPHPDNPGPWFKRHFHRVFEDDNEDDTED